MCSKKKYRVEDKNFKNEITEKLNLSKNSQDLGVEIKAILGHLTRETNQKDSS